MGLLGTGSALSQSSLDNGAGDPVVALNGQTGGNLHNNRISAMWEFFNGGHLALIEIRKIQRESDVDPSLLLEGPFAIELKDVGVVRASDLLITGEGRVEKLKPNPSASRAVE